MNSTPLPVVEDGMKSLYVSEILYLLGTGLIKMSFGLTLLRFLKKRSHTIVLKVVVGVITVETAVLISLIVTFCSPINYYWKQVRDPYMIATVLGVKPQTLGYGAPQGWCRPFSDVVDYNDCRRRHDGHHFTSLTIKETEHANAHENRLWRPPGCRLIRQFGFNHETSIRTHACRR